MMNHSQSNPEPSNQQGPDPRTMKNPQLSHTQPGNHSKPLNFEGKIHHIREALSYFSPELVEKSSDELFSLLTDEKEFIELFNSLPEIKNQNSTLKDFQKGNEELALDNLGFKEQLENLKVEIEAKVKEIKELEISFQSLKENESRNFEKFHPKTILYRLREEQTIIDSESCEFTAQFLRKDLSIEEYIKKYRDSRTRFHQYELRVGSIGKRALPVLDSVGTSIKFFGN